MQCMHGFSKYRCLKFIVCPVNANSNQNIIQLFILCLRTRMILFGILLFKDDIASYDLLSLQYIN